MANFTGTIADEIITPSFVSPTVTATGGLTPSNAADFIDAGAGNDTIDSGGGNDTVTGGRGDDVAILGSGNDKFIWNPGDGSDIVEGGTGTDTLAFNGSNVSEQISISANGSRATLFRDIAAVTMDLNSVEKIDLKALGGADTITVNDLTGTDVKQIAIDLAATGGAGDGQGDTVIVNGAAGGNHISVVSNGTSVVVNGLAAKVTIDGAEAANDFLAINGLDGNDTVNASGLNAGQVRLFIDGGAGDDTIRGSNGGDILLGGDGNDRLIGGTGDDHISGNAGDDVITGGGGNDVIDGGDDNDIIKTADGVDFLQGGAGNDTIESGGGNDTIEGGSGNDVVKGGAGNDLAQLGDGDDLFTWNAGDGSDVVDGGAGTDTLAFNGSIANETITIMANGTHVSLTRDVDAITMDISGVENVSINTGSGDDTIVARNGLATLTKLTIDAGSGNDTITGGDGADLIFGRDGNDTVAGGRGNDIAFLGSGNDRFTWNPGDGSDTVEGEGGFDTLAFNGSNANEHIDISANGGRARFFRDIAAVTMDLNGVERIEFAALGGADTVTVNDLSGTAVKQVAVNLAAFGGAGDGQADTVIVNGTAGNNHIMVVSSGTSVVVNGLPAQVTVNGAEASNDTLVVNGLAGNDTIDGSALNAGQINLVIDGGAGNDTITGSAGNDTLIGGIGNDVIRGGVGNHLVLMGEGDDRFIWNPGDGNATVEGDAGLDTVQFNGANTSDTISVTANGTHAALIRNGVIVDVNVENVVISTGDGDDTIVAGNGLAALTKLTIDGGAGNDTIISGDGADLIFGRDGNDTVAGGRGNDIAFLGSGNDRFAWNPGDGSDTVEGEGGFDTLAFNGSNANEHIDISANGGRARLFRDIAAITMDLNGVERIEFAALGGADTITVNDLSGTNVKQVAVNLAVIGGVGDGQADTVIVNGTAVNNNITIASSGASIVVNGLSAQVTIDGAEASNDTLVVNGLDGNDTINASALNAGQINLVIDGGAGNDTITGSTGNDTLIGGIGNDVIRGGLGNHLVLMGDGDDRFIWNAGDGNATVEGDAGFDTVAFNGTGTSDTISVTANGPHAALIRNGVIVNVNVENVVISAGDGDDTIIAGNGLAALTKLTIDGGAGNDTITGGDGADLILAGVGDDIVAGGRGNDVAFLGSGNDRFTWNPGDGSDTVEGEGGFDTLTFNGANIAEHIDISANGDRVRFTRDIAAITMDLHGVERIEFAALGGADVITVSDLSGTNVKQVAVNLAAIGGVGDGQADTVIVNGTAGDNHISVVGSGTSVVVNGLSAQVTVSGAEASNDTLVVNGLAGNDILDGSALAAGQINLVLDGGAGDDTITGSAGNDTLIGGVGNDVIRGGLGNHLVLMGDGDDRFIWNPGDGNATVEGDAGFDTVAFNGSNASDTITIVANGTHAALIRNGVTVNVNVENVVISAGNGDDVISAGNGLATLTSLTIDAGAGDDTVTGGDGADLILAGTGNDTVAGGRGNDTALLGSGNDRFIWNPGDGSDTVEGESGFDTLAFNGANITEHIDITANGDRVRFTRDVAAITMDLHGVERVEFAALGGADTITVSDLTGTDVKQVALNLAATGGAGDGQADTVIVNGTGGDDHISVVSNGASVVVNGLSAQVTIDGAEAANDLLVIRGFGGNDTIDASGLGAGHINLQIEGGTGDDTIIGSGGNDIIFGSAGNDVMRGGAGDDTFVWNPGDGSDTLEGQTGTDTLLFNGTNINENITIAANGSHAAFFRDVANITMDTHGVENIDFNALGGADNVTVGDMTGTDVKQVTIDLAASIGGSAGDGVNDTVTVNGTSGSDVIVLAIENGALVISGLASKIVIEHFDFNDTIHIAGLGGDDVIEASGVGANGPKLILDGGDGADVLIGGAGNDTLLGGAGDDVLIGGPGQDVLDGGPGSNVVIQSIVTQPAPTAVQIHSDFHMV